MLSLAFQPALIIEDDASFADAAARWLLELGYEAKIAASARAAVELLNEPSECALILLDLGLPDVSGHTLLRQLRMHGPVAPVIVMSGTEEVGDVVRAWRERASDFLHKPFTLDDLKAAIIRARARWDRARAPPSTPASHPEVVPEPSQAPPGSLPVSVERASNDAVPHARRLRPVVALLNEAIRDGSINLPAIDPSVANLRRFLSHRDYTQQDVVSLFARDHALTAKILRTVNLPIHGVHAAMHSLDEACTRLGAHRVVGIVLEIAIRRQFTLAGEPFEGIMEKLWRNAVVTARIAEVLARALERPDVSTSYLIALLHNLGEIVCVKLFSDASRTGHSLPNEARICGEITEIHEHFGRAVASTWKLPRALVKIVARHHRPASVPEHADDRSIRNLVLAAWALAIEHGYDYFPEHPGAESRRYLEALAISLDGRDHILSEIRELGIAAVR